MATAHLHVSIELHEAFRRHCSKRGLKMKDRIEELIRRELEDAELAAKVVAFPVAKPPPPTPPARRYTPPPVQPPEDSSDPWTRPPFWRKR